MDWLGALPAILIALAVLLVPGLAIGLVLRLRLFDAVALAPLVTVTLISVSAVAAPFAGIGWSVLPVLVLTVLVLAACFGITRFAWYPARTAGSGEHSFLRHQGPWFAAAAAAFLLIGWQVVHIIGAPENFSQTFDNNFHLNAVRYILDTGNASSLTLTSMTSADQPAYFYPAAWHGFVSLIVQLSGAPITAATSAAIIAVSAAVWPLSVLFAVRRLAKLVPAAVLGAGILVGSFSAFPILLLDFGVLYPNLLSLAMVPAALVTNEIVPNARFVPELMATATPSPISMMIGSIQELVVKTRTSRMKMMAATVILLISVTVDSVATAVETADPLMWFASPMISRISWQAESRLAS